MSQPPIECKSEIGITIGLVDALISILRILSKRDLTQKDVLDALADLKYDEDFAVLQDVMNSIR